MDLRTVPAWVTSWYPNDPQGQKIAAVKWLMAHSTEAERAASKAFTPSDPTFACESCGRFAFSKPTTCFWCTTGRKP